MCSICQLALLREHARSSGNYSASEADPALSASALAALVEATSLPLSVLDDQSADGAGGTVTANSASGDLRIDGLLTFNRWANTSLTYSDPTRPETIRQAIS